jgi:hypothetical protein
VNIELLKYTPREFKIRYFNLINIYWIIRKFPDNGQEGWFAFFLKNDIIIFIEGLIY